MINIYKLIDPITNEVRYVGKTQTSLLKRLIGHIRELESNINPKFSIKNEWISDLLSKGHAPKIELIEQVEESLTKEKEKYWVNYYSKSNSLLNVQYNLHEGYSKSVTERKSKTIFEYDLEGNFIREWKSIMDAATSHNIESSNISYAASGKRKCAGISMWRYYKQDKIPCYLKDTTAKEVHKYSLEGDYISSYKSARCVPNEKKDIYSYELVPYKQISKCCNGDIMSVMGFRYSLEKVDKLPTMIRKKAIKKLKLQNINDRRE